MMKAYKFKKKDIKNTKLKYREYNYKEIENVMKNNS